MSDSASPVTPDVKRQFWIRVLFIALIVAMIVFAWWCKDYLNLRGAPRRALNIYVTARQWAWQFQYPDGTKTVAELAVPVNEPVKLTMSSEDVIHGFYVPDLRLNMDVLPNRSSTLWLKATKIGEFSLYCSVYCGAGHSDMTGKVKVLTRSDYENWLLRAASTRDRSPSRAPP